jgi:1-acyl-sn-glycerol-3-phosphate acyltransferase
MLPSPYTKSVYCTDPEAASLVGKTFPGLTFYSRFLSITVRAGAKAKRNRYNDAEFFRSSFEVLRALEEVGVRFEVTGIDVIKQLNTPCIVISNHMSVLETTVLPGIIGTYRKLTFIVKQSLLAYPVFGRVLHSRNPIAVGRANPREDLRAVLEGGVERLERGISIVVFPQTTRTLSFDPAQFNTIGIKLARKADVPVVPCAVFTAAWGNGKYFKDCGKIDASKKVRFAFGEPMRIEGRGNDEHQAIIGFISEKLQEWKEAGRAGEK